MLPCTQKLADLYWKPKGIILSGGTYSVYEEGAPHVDPAFFELGVPILGICYGLQEIAYRLGKDNAVAGTARDYGHADLSAKRLDGEGHVNRLFPGLEDYVKVWMSHGDKLVKLPEGFRTIATTQNSEYAGIAHEKLGREFGIHPDLVNRHPFPRPGLSIRVLGEVTPERIEIARKADDICISMIREARLYDKITQAYAALDPTKAVGVMGDKRVHAEMVILRAVETTDFMTATAFNFPHEFITRVAARITNEVHGVSESFTMYPANLLRPLKWNKSL